MITKITVKEKIDFRINDEGIKMNMTKIQLKKGNMHTSENKKGKIQKQNPIIKVICKIIVYIVYGKFLEHMKWCYAAASILAIILIISGIENDSISILVGFVACTFLAGILFPVILNLADKYDK